MSKKCYAFYVKNNVCLLFGESCKADKTKDCYHQNRVEAGNKKLIPGKHFKLNDML
ncbi:MAG: hypothetical protein GY756_05300 [bacterium]|nr:hypothetical protein [bacterium]